jgi:8-oxo-(d)GTP phosphatase
MTTLFIVRHAFAVAKQIWAGRDAQRPLDCSGDDEAELLASWFDSAPNFIASSPTVRCLGTVLPLFDRFHVDIVTRSELLSGRIASAAELVRSTIARGVGSAVMCTHGEVIPELLSSLPIVDASDPFERCAKGSIWEIQTLPEGLLATYYESAERSRKQFLDDGAATVPSSLSLAHVR